MSYLNKLERHSAARRERKRSKTKRNHRLGATTRLWRLLLFTYLLGTCETNLITSDILRFFFPFVHLYNTEFKKKYCKLPSTVVVIVCISLCKRKKKELDLLEKEMWPRKITVSSIYNLNLEARCDSRVLC